MPEFYIGLMSGTSLDGVDAALVDFSDSSLSVLATHFLPYPDALRTEALALNSSGPDEAHRCALVANEVAGLYVRAVEQILAAENIRPSDINALGCHGQTIRHRPDLGYTIQLCNASLIAERLGVSAVTDFRNRDIAAGGQGAPLVPAFHRAHFHSDMAHRVILNVGGIANLTDLPSQGAVKGFDTGPGNLLLDLWCSHHSGERFDLNGEWARGGRCDEQLLRKFMAEPYFELSPPKSTGRDLFSPQWLEAFGLESYRPIDVQATLLELTARSAAAAVDRHCVGATEVYVCGGGASNAALLERLQANLPNKSVRTTAILGLDPDWVEAVAFAWLARQALKGKAANLPEVTGARGPRILGAIYPA